MFGTNILCPAFSAVALLFRAQTSAKTPTLHQLKIALHAKIPAHWLVPNQSSRTVAFLHTLTRTRLWVPIVDTRGSNSSFRIYCPFTLDFFLKPQIFNARLFSSFSRLTSFRQLQLQVFFENVCLDEQLSGPMAHWQLHLMSLGTKTVEQ